jgi:glycosyltransferase involved in cell wall biosynthesis
MVASEKNGRFLEEEKIKPLSLVEDFPQPINPLERNLCKDGVLNFITNGIDGQKIVESKTTIIIPTLNEENNIKIIINELHRLGFSNILIIDGNSDDSTVEVAKNLGVNVLNQDGKGKGAALRQAFGYSGLGDWIIMMDADGSMNPKEISGLLEPLTNGVDVVKASRFMNGGHSDDMTFIRKIGNKFFVFLVNQLLNAKYTDLCYGYAAFKKEALQKLNPHLKSTSFEIETEIFMKAKLLGLQIQEVPSIELKRIHGKTNLSAFKDGFTILKTILSEAYRKWNFKLHSRLAK